VGWLTWAVISAISVSIVLVIVAAPLSAAQGHYGFAAFVYHTFSFVCHQIPERSFHLAAHPFAVCSRCTGLYVGFAIATLIYPVARSLRDTRTPCILWLLLAAFPLVLDFSLGYFNIWANTHLSRFATGALLSSVAVFYIVPGLIEASSSVKRYLKLTH